MVKQSTKGGLNAESILVPVALLGGQKIVKNYKPDSETSPPEKVVSATKSATISKSVKASKSTKKGGAIAVASSQIAVKSNMTPSPSKETEAPAKKCGKTRTSNILSYFSLKKGGNGDNSQEDDRELAQEEKHIDSMYTQINTINIVFFGTIIRDTITKPHYIYSSNSKQNRDKFRFEIAFLLTNSVDYPVFLSKHLINAFLYLLAYHMFNKYTEAGSMSAENILIIKNLLLFAIAEGGFGEYKDILINKKYFIPMVICGDIIIDNKITSSYIPIINEIQKYKKVFLDELINNLNKTEYYNESNPIPLSRTPSSSSDPDIDTNTASMEERLNALKLTGGCKLSKKVKKGGSSTRASDTASITKSVVAKKTVAKKVDNNSDAKNSTDSVKIKF